VAYTNCKTYNFNISSYETPQIYFYVTRNALKVKHHMPNTNDDGV